MLEAGYYGTIFFTNPSYEDAFLGISSDDRAIYDYEKMVESLVTNEDMTEDEAREFIDYNATFYIEGGPIILYRLGNSNAGTQQRIFERTKVKKY